MNRYIDADALIKDLKRQYMFLFGTDELPNGIQSVIKNFPTADVVPYFIEDGVLTLDLSGIREKIHGCEIKIYFGSDWGGGTDE